MCLFPRVIYNKKYLPNKKNGDRAPTPNDKRVLAVPVGCGKCIECRKQKAMEWRVRLTEEIKNNPTDKFMTFTFSDESLLAFQEVDANEVASRAVELFRKRWYKKYGEGIKHWLIVELGHPPKNPGERSTERVHIHGILWTERSCAEIEKVWGYGWVDQGEYVNEKSINYITKYVTKVDPDHPGFIGKIFCSKGIGSGYMDKKDARNNRFDGNKTNETYRTPSGAKIALPIYYRNKIYDDEEREKLWLQKLDKKVRYVRGMKIDTSTEAGIHEYIDALKEAQKFNKFMGYTDTPWKKEKYEKMRQKFGI